MAMTQLFDAELENPQLKTMLDSQQAFLDMVKRNLA